MEIKRDKDNILCHDCIFEDIKVQAYGLCTTCSEYLCQECCRTHKKSSATRDHNILECTKEEDERHPEKEMRDLDESYCKSTVAELPLCNPCLYDDTKMPAVGFCVICVEYLCQECYRDHKKSKTTRTHNILKENMPTNAKVFSMMKEMTSCSEHPDTPVSHNCKDHKKYVCVMCIAGSHRKCKSVKELMKTQNPDSAKIDETTSKLQTIRKISNMIRVKRKENMESLAIEKSHATCKISAFVDEVIGELQQLKENDLKSANSLLDSEMIRLTNDISICNDFEKDIELYDQILDTAKQHSMDTETDIIADVLGKKILVIISALRKQHYKAEVHMSFRQNPILSEIRALGKITVYQEAPESEPSSTVYTEHAVEQENDGDDDDDMSSASGSDDDDGRDNKEKKGKKQKRNVIETNSTSIKSFGDKIQCSVVGGFVLPGGNIVLVDEANRTVKLFIRNFRIICCKEIEAQPVDVCRTGPKNFAIVYKEMKQIDMFTIVDSKPNAKQSARGIKTVKTIKSDRSFKTKHENIRIALCNTEIVLLCKTLGTTLGSIRLELRQEKNNQLILEDMQSYSNHDEEFDFSQCGLCSTPEGIVVYSRNTGAVCLVWRKPMQCLMVRWKIDLDGRIPGVERIIADTYGNLFVYSTVTGSAYQIAARDHSQITQIATKLKNPVSMTVNDKIAKLFVACKNDDSLYIFDLNKK